MDDYEPLPPALRDLLNRVEGTSVRAMFDLSPEVRARVERANQLIVGEDGNDDPTYQG